MKFEIVSAHFTNQRQVREKECQKNAHAVSDAILGSLYQISPLVEQGPKLLP